MIEEFKAARILKEEFSSKFDEEIHHTNNPVLDPPRIEKNYLGTITQYLQKDNNFYFYDGNATVEVKVVSDEIIRIRLAPNSTFLADFSYAVVNSDQHVDLFELTEDEISYRVKTNAVTCVLNKDNFLISFENRDGKVVNRDYSPMHWEENADFRGFYVYCSKEAKEHEGFFGLGDKPTDLNLRGR